jgi:hypothetical protein
MRSLLLSALFALLPVGLWGCSSSDLAGAESAPTSFSEQAIGESLLFVGTDPGALNTDLYLVGAASSRSDTPSIASAESFELERLTDTGREGSELLLPGDQLFTDHQPHPVPDLQGNRIAMVAVQSNPEELIAVGRVGVFDLTGRDQRVGPEVSGLQGVHFTAEGASLVLERRGEYGLFELLIVPVEDLDADPVAVYLGDEGGEGGFSHEFAGVIFGSDDFLVLSSNESSSTSRVLRVDTLSGVGEVISGGLNGLITEPSLSRDGTMLAATLTQPGDDKRAVVVVDAQGEAHRITDVFESDCYWPSWSPTMDDKFSYQLTFVCQNPLSSRPDIGLWSSSSLANLDAGSDDGESSLEPSESYGSALLTAVSQPSIFEGTMDGLVVRSRPQWDPLGEALIFGVSTHDEAMSGSGMTLLVLPIGGTAYSIYSGDGTSVDWAHFSADAEDQSLLLWERSETGLEDTVAPVGGQPIRVVGIGAPDPAPTYVSLGQDLLVSYPMFLGENTHFYP